MPLKQCSDNGKSGWKYGDSGKCYTGPGAKKKAIKQGVAESYNGGEKFKGSFTEEELKEVWADLPLQHRIAIAKEFGDLE